MASVRKRNNIIIASVAVILLCLSVCYAYERAEEKNQNVLADLAYAGLSSAIDAFSSFTASMDATDYWRAVASFKQYVEAANKVDYIDGYQRQAAYTKGNELFGVLVNRPYLCQKKVSYMIGELESIEQDMFSGGVHLSLERLTNHLVEEGI